MINLAIRFAAVLVLLLLSSCSTAKKYTAPETGSEIIFRDLPANDTTTIAHLPWQGVYKDVKLQALITEGINNNPDLQIAFSRVSQAESYYFQSRAALYPTLGANLSYAESKLSEAQGFGIRTHMSQYNLGLNSSWEADIWGRLSSAKRANLALFLESQAGSQAVRFGLIANIARLYYNLLAFDAQLGIVLKTAENWDNTVATMQKLKLSARVTEAAVVQSKAQKYAVEVTIPELKQKIKETENEIKFLIGQPSGPVDRSLLNVTIMPDSLQAGIPAQLLSNRPDVRRAEFRYRSTFEFTNAARASFYPTVSLTASGGLNSLSLDKLLNPTSLAASIMGGLTQPIFNRRLLKTNLRVAEQEQQVSFLQYKTTLLAAGREVSDALSLYGTATEKISIRQHQVDELRKSVEYTEKLLLNGFADYLEVITARQSLLSAEISQVEDRLEKMQALVTLYRALGGGGN